MRMHYAIPLLLLSLVGNPAAATKAVIHAPEIKITEASRSGRVSLAIVNHSVSTIKLWGEESSWGAGHWRVLVVRKGQLETFYQNPGERFTRNIPRPIDIGTGAQIEKTLDLNGGNWCLLDYCAAYNEQGINGQKVSFQPEDVVVVIYDVPRTDEAISMGVWYGVVATKHESGDRLSGVSR